MKKKAAKANFMVKIPYPFDLMMSFGQDDKELMAALRRKGVRNDLDLIDYGKNCPAKYCFWQRESMFLIRMNSLPSTCRNFGALAHEICHVVNWIMETVGMKLDCDTSGEAYAYLTGWITEQVHQRMNKYY